MTEIIFFEVETANFATRNFWNKALSAHFGGGNMVSRRGNRAAKGTGSSSVSTAGNRDLLVLLVFVLLVVGSLYLAASFIIHFFTWASDQSLSWVNLWRGNEVEAANWMGTFGAALAAICVSRGFGVGALVLPVIIAMLAVQVLGVAVKSFYRRLLMMMVGMVIVSVCLGYLFGSTGGYLGSGLGGDYGLFVSRWMVARMGFPLSGVMVALVSVAYLMWISSAFNRWLRARAVTNTVKMRRMAEQLFGDATPESVSSGSDTRMPEGAAVVEDGVSTETEGCEGGNGSATDSMGVTPDGVPTEYVDCNDFDCERGEEGDSVDGLKPRVPSEEPPVSLTERSPHAVPESVREENPDLPGGETPFREENVEDNPPRGGVEGENAGCVDGERMSKDDDNVETTVVESAPDSPSKVNRYTSDGDYDPSLELPGYQFPPIDLLDEHGEGQQKVSSAELIEKRAEIIKALRTYNVEIANIKIIQGPTVTLYEVVLKKGILIKKIKNLEDDIAMSLSALSVRIIAPIPGRGTVGIEVPNAHPSVVSMRNVLRSAAYEQSRAILPVAIGRTISNQVYVFDLAKMPHLLVAGATGQGKSVGLNVIITSLLYRKHPSQLKFVFVDPKKVELSLYSKIEHHYLAKIPGRGEAIITDVDLVVETLVSLCKEMDTRYELLKAAMVRNIEEYNERFISGRLPIEKHHRYLPYIVVVIDEYADLIMTAGRDVEQPIARLAQLARAIGIHLVIATQRPTANIITGMIKANFPARIAFRVSSAVDSRTIIDQSGASQLIGRGDMLISEGTDLVRLQCAFLDMPELERITDFISNQPGYESAYLLPDSVGGAIEDPAGEGISFAERDGLFEDVARMVVDEGRCSTSAIQRKYSIGFNRAGRIVDQLEAAGIVGPQESSKPRAVLLGDRVALERVLADLA